MDITIDGPHTIVYLIAIRVTDFTEGQTVLPKPPGTHDPDRGPRPNSGFIGLQNHPGSEVYFKEASLLPLSRQFPEQLFFNNLLTDTVTIPCGAVSMANHGLDSREL
jgi:hypothetical protein